jgi:hypothetical protein
MYFLLQKIYILYLTMYDHMGVIDYRLRSVRKFVERQLLPQAGIRLPLSADGISTYSGP